MRTARIMSSAMFLAFFAGCAGQGNSAARPNGAVAPADRAAIESVLGAYAEAYAAGDTRRFNTQFFTVTPAQADFVSAWAELAAAGARLWPVAAEQFGEDDAATLFSVAEVTPPPAAHQFLGEIPTLGMAANGRDAVTVGARIAACCPYTAMKRVGGKWKIDLPKMLGGEPTFGEAEQFREIAASMTRIADEIAGGAAKTYVDYLRELRR